MAHYDYKKTGKKLTQRFWWKSKKGEVHDDMWGVVDAICSRQDQQARKDLYHAQLYTNENIRGLDQWSFRKYATGGDNRSSYNIVESCVDTLLSETVQNRQSVNVLTDEGNWDEQERAKGLMKFCDGQFYTHKINDEIGPRLILGALVFGDSAVKVFSRNGKPVVEYTHIHEIVVDECEAFHGKPRNMFHTRRIPRDVATALWPEHKNKIKDTEEAQNSSVGDDETVSDLVEIREGWHLPSVEGGTDGRHVICLENITLLDEKWTRDGFPFAFLSYKRPLQGFRGCGLVEVLSEHQIGINDFIERVYEKLMLGPGNMIFVSPGSKFTAANIENVDWNVFETSDPPNVVVPNSVPPDFMAELDRRIDRAWTAAGINQLQAKSQIPAGLAGGSGKALNIYNNTKSKRFMDFQQSYEATHVAIAEKLVEIADDLFNKENIDVSVLSPSISDGTASLVKWSDVNLSRDKYVMRIFPASSLSSSPQGKISELLELMKINPIYGEDAARILNFPDLNAHTSVLMAPREIIKKNIHQILKTAQPMSPEPFDDLALVVKLGTTYYHKARLGNAPEENLSALSQYILMAHEMIKQAQQPPPQEVMPEGMPQELPPGPEAMMPPGPPPMAV